MALPRYLILDVDDTLTTEGRLGPNGGGLAALAAAQDAGIEVILNTGRSAGWGAALLAYLPGVSAVVVENGGAWFDRVGCASEEVFVTTASSGPIHREPLFALRESLAIALGLPLRPTADDVFRLTDHTVVRTIPASKDGFALLAQMKALVDQAGFSMLASSVHIHLFQDAAEHQRSKAQGVESLLRARGIAEPAWELAHHAVAIGDSANDVSFFEKGRFALALGVHNIERYLPELGEDFRPSHISKAKEGHGVLEFVGELLAGRLRV